MILMLPSQSHNSTEMTTMCNHLQKIMKMILCNTEIILLRVKTGLAAQIVISRRSTFQDMMGIFLRSIVKIYMERVLPKPRENQLMQSTRKVSTTASRTLLLLKMQPNLARITSELLKMSLTQQRSKILMTLIISMTLSSKELK